jgi:hypothetical protein
MLKTLLVILTMAGPVTDMSAQGQKPDGYSDVQELSKTDVEASPSTSEEPHRGPKQKESNYMFGVLPNFGTVESGVARTPIGPQDKMKIASQNAVDPVVYATTTAVALATANYGRNAPGYVKQYAASLADLTAASYLTTWALPSILHQDPRYVQRGSGGQLARMLYASSRVAVTATDAGEPQFNWSEVLGQFATASIGNIYYPVSGRTLSGTLSRWGTFMAMDALSYELKEFWPDVRRWLHRGGSSTEK